jgi:hypothetical protein
LELSMKLVFKTDQTDCYDVEGRLMACAGSGQDGELRAGVNWPNPRFEVQTQTVYDRLSGLMWTKDAALSRYPLMWKEALDFVREMNRASAFGYQDWKLPSRGELFGLISHAHINPALPYGAPFENVFTGYYWTATTCSRLEDQAWYIHLGGGRIYRGMKYGSYMVWPVRCRSNGHASVSAASRYLTENGMVYDRLRGLGWAKMNAASSDLVNWPAALDFIRRMNAAHVHGHADWRLPNVRELESLVDARRHTPALFEGHPFIRTTEGCWSSTTSVFEPRYAWVLYMQDGAVGVGYKKHAEFHVWAVRGGIA